MIHPVLAVFVIVSTRSSTWNTMSFPHYHCSPHALTMAHVPNRKTFLSDAVKSLFILAVKASHQTPTGYFWHMESVGPVCLCPCSNWRRCSMTPLVWSTVVRLIPADNNHADSGCHVKTTTSPTERDGSQTNVYCASSWVGWRRPGNHLVKFVWSYVGCSSFSKGRMFVETKVTNLDSAWKIIWSEIIPTVVWQQTPPQGLCHLWFHLIFRKVKVASEGGTCRSEFWCKCIVVNNGGL